MEAPEVPAEEEAVEAREAPEVWERPAEATAATAPADETVLMVRRGGAEASP